MSILLSVESLVTQFSTGAGTVRAVDGATWEVKDGETVALVGELGCAKSVSALSIMRRARSEAAGAVSPTAYARRRAAVDSDRGAAECVIHRDPNPGERT